MDMCNNMLFESGASCVFIFQTGQLGAGSRFRLDLSTLVPVLFFVASSIFPHVYYFAGFAAAVCAQRYSSPKEIFTGAPHVLSPGAEWTDLRVSDFSWSV